MSRRCVSTALQRSTTMSSRVTPFLCRQAVIPPTRTVVSRMIPPSDNANVMTSQSPPASDHNNHTILFHHNHLQQQQHLCRPGPSYSFDQYQVRYFDSRRRQKKRKKVANPFKVLGVSEKSMFKDVKKAFLVIAMKNHPDTAAHEDVSEEEKDEMREIFIEARIAFESLTECTIDGVAIRKSEEEDIMENFDSWFKDETGYNSPFALDMDPETMKEVAKMTEDLGPGLDRDGGMWTLAKMVTSAVKSGGEAGAMLRIDAGDSRTGPGSGNSDPNGSLRRRRRR